MDFERSTKPKSSKATLWTLVALAGGVFVLYSLFYTPHLGADAGLPFVQKAVATVSGDSKVTGTVTFTQKALGHPVLVSGTIKGLDANAQRGFHVHALGDLSSGCASAGPHFNPFNENHGAPGDVHRHAGDFGNIFSDGNGVAEFAFEDKFISLNGPLSVIGRALMVHAGTDDLGRGDNDESLKTGNAGGRSACGVIGVASSD